MQAKFSTCVVVQSDWLNTLFHCSLLYPTIKLTMSRRDRNNSVHNKIQWITWYCTRPFFVPSWILLFTTILHIKQENIYKYIHCGKKSYYFVVYNNTPNSNKTLFYSKLKRKVENWTSEKEEILRWILSVFWLSSAPKAPISCHVHAPC